MGRIRFTQKEWVAAAHGRPIEHGLRPKHPHAVLDITTELATAGDAVQTGDAGTLGAAITRYEILVRPTAAEVGAEIAAGPIVDWCCCLGRPIGRNADRRDRDTAEQKLAHRRPPTGISRRPRTASGFPKLQCDFMQPGGQSL